MAEKSTDSKILHKTSDITHNDIIKVYILLYIAIYFT